MEGFLPLRWYPLSKEPFKTQRTIWPDLSPPEGTPYLCSTNLVLFTKGSLCSNNCSIFTRSCQTSDKQNAFIKAGVSLVSLLATVAGLFRNPLLIYKWLCKSRSLWIQAFLRHAFGLDAEANFSRDVLKDFVLLSPSCFYGMPINTVKPVLFIDDAALTKNRQRQMYSTITQYNMSF